jgi:hypothetical protein
MHKDDSTHVTRREALKACAATAVGAALTTSGGAEAAAAETREPSPTSGSKSKYCGEYCGEGLSRVAFPMGGMGAGMICLEGAGALSHFSLRNKPEVFHEPCTFAAIAVKGSSPVARVLEGPVPGWKLFGQPGTGNGAGGTSFGLPRFREARFRVRFPFATVTLRDKDVPLEVEITGWSPFEPGDADSASLPVAALEYRLTNKSSAAVEAVFSWSARNFMAARGNPDAVRSTPGGFVLWGGPGKDRPHEEGAFSATVDDPAVKVNHAWFRGGWFDPLTMAWKDVAAGACYDRPPVAEGAPSPGATLFVPLTLAPGASKTIVLRLAWYAGQTSLRVGKDPQPSGAQVVPGSYRPWYAGRFAGVGAVTAYWRDHYEELRRKTQRFSECFYDTTLPPEVIDAAAANLTILKSPTVMRQADGRLWSWEGCGDSDGCCAGSCTHVWNYAQAIAHLFPALERTLRETEFGPSQDDRGHQQFRSALPIRPVAHDFHAAADGQLGGIMKVHREWRISGDTEWLRRLWPKVKASLDYCIREWDPGHKGWLEEPHHNTYDIEFWGPDGMCTSFYLGALKAAVLMGKALGEDIAEYSTILEKGLRRMEQELFDGDYFIQKIEWKNLRAKNPLEVKSMVGNYSPEARALLEKEGPKYQYGAGCLDGPGVRRGPGDRRPKDRQSPEGRVQTQLQARPDGPPQSPAAQLRLRERRRPAAVYVAQRRGAFVAVRLFQRSLDGHRVPGGVTPDADGPGAGRPRDRPHVPRPLRRPRAQPVQRVRVRPLVRPGHVELRPPGGPQRRPLRRGGKSAPPPPSHRGRLPLVPQHGHRLRDGGHQERKAVRGGQSGGDRDSGRQDGRGLRAVCLLGAAGVCCFARAVTRQRIWRAWTLREVAIRARRRRSRLGAVRQSLPSPD